MQTWRKHTKYAVIRLSKITFLYFLFGWEKKASPLHLFAQSNCWLFVA